MIVMPAFSSARLMPAVFGLFLVFVAAAAMHIEARAAGPQAADRKIEFNGRPLDAAGLKIIQSIEQQVGPVPDGRYWYDGRTGAAGLWGGPVAAVIAPGLALGGALPAQASGGGDGRLTGVFVNGRELHPFDVKRLQTVGAVVPGRYNWDSAGNVSLENGQPLFNFFAAVRQSGRGDPFYTKDANNHSSAFVSKGCTAVSGRTRASDESSTYDYYVGC
ncbi:hypothetical protein DFR24_0313 [Panacagrimonas perspica]|uniref:Uncharacterized protein n=2 Tax=Panacagrimonas perspica TaxID=381431 RepID=A0A4S3K1R6_9GAMM|nr:hypothetical protein DFR24_0313 [Panacagrimonas perspica]THD01893.1 hypothetical protein B1810_18005 [Panacagrimonas perspica]